MRPLYRYGALLTFLLLANYSFSGRELNGFRQGQSIPLAVYTNPADHVVVSIRLENTLGGIILLSATFSPPEGYHLYSKDLPRQGWYGQGRPTLLELPPDARMRSAGALSESVPAGMSGNEPDGPLVYPAGPVTLSLPVQLPAEASRDVRDEVSVTFMVCNQTLCQPPTEGKLIPVEVPSQTAIHLP